MAERIVSLLSSATEMVAALGLADALVGISHECDYPAEVMDRPRVTRTLVDDSQPSDAIDQQVRTLYEQGEPLYTVDEPLLVSLQPDLIVTQAQCDVCAVRYEDVIVAQQRHDALREVPVLALNPASLADIIGDIRRIGAAAGAGEQAAICCQGLQDRVDAVRAATGNLPPEHRAAVAVMEWTEPLMLAGNWMPELIALAGGHCDLTTAGEHSPVVPWQRVRDHDPEVIVVAPCGFALERTVQEAASLFSLPGWYETPAARSGRVFAVDGSAYFNRSGPRMVDSLELLAHLFHPSLAPRPGGMQAGTAWQRLM